MALPKLNDTPKYSMKIPSMGLEVRFRPFLVKEEKVMLMALESDDQRQQLMSIVDTLKACVDGEVDWDKLTTFDVEYMFNQLRGKSVGETASIMAKCEKEECGHDTEVVINVDKLNIEMPSMSNVIELTPDISVEMSYPSYKNIMNESTSSDNETDQMFKILKTCLISVTAGDERINLKDETDAEIHSFIDSFDSGQFQKIRDYIDSMPTLEHEIEFVCSKCGHENKQTISGIQNFF